MRVTFTTLAALGVLAATPALAQSSLSRSNAANESLARQGEVRSLQQNQQTESNQLRMESQRNQLSQPAPLPTPGIVGPRH